jgi:glycopeptide antibiotics resistance protein
VSIPAVLSSGISSSISQGKPGGTIPTFLYPLLPYRSYFFPFLVLSAIAVPCWLVFRLYRLRTSGHGLSFRREILLLTFVVYLCGLATATLIPNHNSRSAAQAAMGVDLRPNLASLTCSSASLPSGSTARAFCLHNARGNGMLFFPLGILIPLVWTRLRFWSGIRIAIAVSVSIELTQYLSMAWSNRNADVNDVLLNVLGASLGLAIVFLLRLRGGTHPAVARA